MLRVDERFVGLVLTLSSIMLRQARTDVPKRLRLFAKSACTYQCVCFIAVQLDLTDQKVLKDESVHALEDHASVADRAAGLDKGRSGKLHESDSMHALNSLSKGTPMGT